MGTGWCCGCCAPKKAPTVDEIVLPPSSTTEIPGVLKGSTLSVAGQPADQVQTQPSVQVVSQSPRPAPPTDDTPKKTLSPEEKEAEIQRLKQVVKQFAQDALSGIPVNVFALDDYRTSPAVFQINKELTMATITLNDVNVGDVENTEPRSYPLAEITSILRERNLVQSLPDFPATYSEQSLLLLFGTNRLALLLRDNEEQQRFFQSLSMLRYVSKTQTRAEM